MEVDIIVEVPQGSRNKYEYDPLIDAIRLDRMLFTSTRYPHDYGFIPGTLAEDGDPADILVVSHTPVVPGAVIRCRPVGVLKMTDEAGGDEKVLAVPVDKLHPMYGHVKNWTDLPNMLTAQIGHFFQHYKDLDIAGWGDAEEAARIIQTSIDRFKTEADEAAKYPSLADAGEGQA